MPLHTATLKGLDVNCKWDRSLVQNRVACNGNGIKVLKKVKKGSNGKVLVDYLRDWVQRKMEFGLPQSCYFLPFLVGAKRLVECLDCHKNIYPGEEVLCTVRGCQGVYHKTCAEESLRMSNPKKNSVSTACNICNYYFTFGILVLFLWLVICKVEKGKRVCFVCRQRLQWRCVCCTMASHDKCSPWSDAVIHLKDKPGRAICWRHPTNWRLDKKHAVPATEIEEIFCQLPLPYVDEEFKLDMTWRDLLENKFEPPPYVHIKCNVYLVKKKRDDVVDDIGCTSCSSTCSEDCVCRVQCISCSKACRCPESCTNKPFSKEKKIRIVKTELCGWGVEAAEPIKKGDFVTDFNLLSKMSTLALYISTKDVLEKWQVEGETRIGLFAARSIEVGKPLTYDYRFVQFGTEVNCHCGQGYLGTKRKIVKLELCWGTKRRRTSTACLAIITV
ncbi:ASH1-related 3, SET domain group 4 [Hibiscus trionum]|uniref:ASH1-related 3, SET domain group 4 n=1 Tax=Hibiscus trionum TaxID=183268 RepID=A0A9W7JJC7_HIBTR|nr:ASH1-related 3, SET domain group 4 [Hibiscus trionum]